MAVSKGFLEFILEGLEPLGDVSSNRMFGGAGIYIDGKIIGIIGDDQMYFKVDDTSRSIFEQAGLSPFSYQKKDGTVGVMSYYGAPEAIYDDPEEMVNWGREAFGAALRAPVKKPKKKKQKK